MTTEDANRHVRDYLKFYIEFPHAPRYAVMLKGAWGVGKTHLVRNFLREHFTGSTEKTPYKYVSLYGITSTEDLDRAVIAAHFPLLNGKAAKLISRASGMTMEFFGIDASKPKLSDVLGSVRGGLYVFDDLERCGLSVNAALGYINEFVEHDECKVILIANEDEISVRKKSYLRKREKLIGQTLEVQSSFPEAFSHFVDSVDDSFSKEFLTRNSDILSEIFRQSETNNLRLLQQTIWDFERLARTFSEEHKKNDDALKAAAAAFFALSFEVKSGRIKESDLLDRTSNLIARMKLNQEKKEDSPYLKAVERYAGTDIGTSLLSNEVLADVLGKGIVDGQAVRHALDGSPQYASPEDVPAWRVLWDWTEQPEHVAEAALKKVSEQFLKREFVVSGEVLHVVGMRLNFATIGILNLSREEVVAEAKQYIDDLYGSRRLEVLQRGNIHSLRRGGYGGLGFHEQDSKELREIAIYIEAQQTRAELDSHPEKARELVKEMQKDAHLFYRRLNLTNDSENVYYDVPIVAAIDFDEFMAAFMALSPAQQRTVLHTFHDRYKRAPSQLKELAAEAAWIQALNTRLEQEAEKMSPIGAARLRQLTKWQLGEAVEAFHLLAEPASADPA